MLTETPGIAGGFFCPAEGRIAVCFLFCRDSLLSRLMDYCSISNPRFVGKAACLRVFWTRIQAAPHVIPGLTRNPVVSMTSWMPGQARNDGVLLAGQHWSRIHPTPAHDRYRSNAAGPPPGSGWHRSRDWGGRRCSPSGPAHRPVRKPSGRRRRGSPRGC